MSRFLDALQADCRTAWYEAVANLWGAASRHVQTPADERQGDTWADLGRCAVLLVQVAEEWEPFGFGQMLRLGAEEQALADAALAYGRFALHEVPRMCPRAAFARSVEHAGRIDLAAVAWWTWNCRGA